MTTPIDHPAEAVARLITQFKESANLIGYIESLLSESDEVEDVNQQLLEERWLDTAVGAQLDIIGEIVGQPRNFSIQPVASFFGFSGAVGSASFGTVGDSLIGDNFKSISDIEFGEGRFDDDTYRIMIRAKIGKNRTKCIINEIIDIVLTGITSASTVILTESNVGAYFGFDLSVGAGTFDSLSGASSAENFVSISDTDPSFIATFKLTFVGVLTEFDKSLLVNTDFTPKPAGVRVLYADDNGDFS